MPKVKNDKRENQNETSFHGELFLGDKILCATKKNKWLDEKIRTGVPGVWWTERYEKYYAKYKNHFLGEFDTQEQAVNARLEAEELYSL